jgi:hypothetical protein
MQSVVYSHLKRKHHLNNLVGPNNFPLSPDNLED